MRAWRPLFARSLFVSLAVAACSRSKDAGHDGGSLFTSSDSEDAFSWPLNFNDPAEATAPRKGMIFIPAGTLVSGTPKDRTPRLADQEPAGEPVPLRGFFIDEYAYPNEAGAIPKSGMSRDEAAVLCGGQGKRLCTELEWERACKGPNNTTYEYGDQYRAAECATGVTGRLSPSGLRVACKSAFGVHDMHGGAWEWTSSLWRRGNDAVNAVVRGGNSEAGELAGRCANAMALAPRVRRPDVGARCCAGDPNDAEVSLSVARGKPLAARPANAALTAALGRIIQDKAPPELPADPPFHIERVFVWHPVGNEELLVAAGCVKRSPHSSCGAFVFRARADEGRAESLSMVGFAASGFWIPVVRPDHQGHDLWVYGGDARTTFRRRVAYVSGKIAIGDPERPGKRGG